MVEGAGSGGRSGAADGDAPERRVGSVGEEGPGERDRAGLDDLDGLEAGLAEQAEVVRLVERAGDAPGVELGRVADGVGKIAARDYVGDAEVTARPEHAGHLGERTCLVGYEVKHAVRDHHVHRRISERQRFDVAVLEGDVAVAELRRIRARLLDHLRREVHAEHTARLADDPAGDERVEPRACAEVEHGLPRREAGVFYREPAAELEVGVGYVALDAVVGVADHVDFGRPIGGAAAGERLASGDGGVRVAHGGAEGIRSHGYIVDIRWMETPVR